MKHFIPDVNPFPGFDIIPLGNTQILTQFNPYFWMLAGIYALCALFYTLYQKDITVESALKAFTLKKAIKSLASIVGAITVIVPFIHLVLSFVTGKH